MKKLLACIDGSLYGQTCCQYASWFSSKTGALADMLYVSELWQYEAPLVADFGGSLGAQPYMGLTAQLRQIEEEKSVVIKEYLHESFEKVGLGSRIVFHHRTGVLVDSIGEFEGGESPAELIIVGKRGEGANMAKAHLGANMERVVRATSLPCFVANREFFEPRNLLLAYDGSESAHKAVVWLGANKAAFEGLALHVVSVAKAGEGDKASARLSMAERALVSLGFTPKCQVLTGIPADAISAYQQSNDINLLLMGAYGHSRIRRLLIGSTTTELLQRCRVPVVLFR
ncbi:MAG: universal stress protein [Puniceicoccales bacterium]|nr:universal stress protein [Puniceicoccales bacterium]